MSHASIILVHFFTVHGQTITLNDQTHARHLRNKIAKAYIGSSLSLRFKVSSSLCRRNDPNHKRSNLDCFRLRPETLSNSSSEMPTSKDLKSGDFSSEPPPPPLITLPSPLSKIDALTPSPHLVGTK